MNQFKEHFSLDNESAYQQWKEQKLEDYPTDIEDIIVEVKNPMRLSKSELEEMRRCVRKTNMVIFSGTSGNNPDKQIPLNIGSHFGLTALDNNSGADDDGISSLEVKENKWHENYIPYTNRQIHWHTDGYYNDENQQIFALLLHCVRSAVEGGENALMDHEIAYIILRDHDPVLIEAFMHADAMTIPENRSDDKVNRPARAGPVFMPTSCGNLHMRYTARKKNVIWRNDSDTQHARIVLDNVLKSDIPYIFRATLQPGQGLVSNNILHDRSGFNDDDESPRLLYRLRYYDRI